MVRKLKGDESESSTVDLGLGDLLAASEAATPIVNGSNATSPNKQIAEDLDSMSKFESLAAAADWSQLVKIADESLVESGEDPTVRLWWIRGQLHGGKMPVAILCAPLEAAADELAQIEATGLAPKLRNLVTESLLECAEALTVAQDFELAFEFYRRALRFSGQAVNSLQKFAVAELERLDSLPRWQQPGMADYRTELVEVVSSVRKDSSPVTNAQHTRAKSIWRLVIAVPLVLGTGGGAVGLWWYYGWPKWFSRGEPIVSTPTVDSTATIKLETQPPLLERVGVKIGPSLKSVLQELDDQVAERDQVVATKTTAVNADEGVESPIVKAERELAVLDTLGPVEPERVRDMRQGGAVVDSDSDQQTTKASLKTRLNLPRDAKVITTSEVREHPSERATVIAEVRAKRTVRLSERLGGWFRIVSKSNREGYLRCEAVGDCPDS